MNIKPRSNYKPNYKPINGKVVSGEVVSGKVVSGKVDSGKVDSGNVVSGEANGKGARYNKYIYKFIKIFKEPTIIKFIETNFNIKTSIRKNNVYYRVINYYETDRETIEKLLSKLHILGSWKEYFQILYLCRKKHTCNFTKPTRKFTNLERYIYKILSEQFLKDIKLVNSVSYEKVSGINDLINIKNNTNDNYISTLAKHLPRQKSKLNKLLNFSDNFDIFNDFYLEKPGLYNHYVKHLNDILGGDSTFIRACNAKEFNKIKFTKLSRSCIKKHYNIIINNEILLENYKIFLYNYYNNYNIYEIVNLLFNYNKLNDITKNIINELWSNKVEIYLDNLERDYNIQPTNNIYVELSNKICNNKNKYLFINVIILLYINNHKIFNTNNQEILINDQNTIYNKFNKIKQYMAPNNFLNNYDGLIFTQDNTKKNAVILNDNNICNNNKYYDYPIKNKNSLIIKEIVKNCDKRKINFIKFCVVMFFVFLVLYFFRF